MCWSGELKEKVPSSAPEAGTAGTTIKPPQQDSSRRQFKDLDEECPHRLLAEGKQAERAANMDQADRALVPEHQKGPPCPQLLHCNTVGDSVWRCIIIRQLLILVSFCNAI